MPDESTETIKILVVEDHVLTRIGLKTLLQRRPDMQIIGEAGNGDEAVTLATKLSPDLILMDVGMPVMDGIEAAKQIREQHPNINIIMLTSHDNERDIFASFAAGAAGYCLKDIEPERLFTAISTINAGDVWIDSTIASKVLRQYTEEQPETQEQPKDKFFTVSRPQADQGPIQEKQAPPETTRSPLPEPLSPREREVMSLIVEGLSNQQIADRLIVSLATAKTHVRNILNKLAVDDRTQAAVSALRQGLAS